MFTEIRKSLSSILEERISSPFYGSLAISWVLWNWRAVCATFFVGQEYIKPKTKIEYLYSLYDHGWIVNALYLAVAPLASAVILIVYVPKITNALFKISLQFEKERMNAREEQTASQRLTIEQSAAIRNEVSEQAKKYNELLAQKDTDLATAKEQASQLLKQKMQLAFLYSEYGTTEKSIEVTQVVQNILYANKKMIANNEVFGNDPAPGKYKRLLVVYNLNGETKHIVAREHEEIQLEDKTGDVMVASSERSKQMYDQLIDNEVLSSISMFFPGTWKLQYEGAIIGEEEVQVINKNQYFVKTGNVNEFVHYFNLEHMQVNLEEYKIQFYKKAVQPNDDRNVQSELEIVEVGKLYKGIENGGTVQVVYTRLS